MPNTLTTAQLNALNQDLSTATVGVVPAAFGARKDVFISNEGYCGVEPDSCGSSLPGGARLFDNLQKGGMQPEFFDLLHREKSFRQIFRCLHPAETIKAKDSAI